MQGMQISDYAGYVYHSTTQGLSIFAGNSGQTVTCIFSLGIGEKDRIVPESEPS